MAALTRELATSPGASPATVYLSTVSAGSRPRVRSALRLIARRLGYDDYEACPWHELRYEHVAAIRAGLLQHYATPSSANNALSILRNVLRQAWLLGLMPQDEYERAREVNGSRSVSLPPGHALADDEIARMLAVCDEDETTAGARDGAAIATLVGTGLRRAELCALMLEDYDRRTHTFQVLHGKGDKARLAYPPPPTVRRLARWLAVRGGAPGPLFLPIAPGGLPIPRRHISTGTVYHLIAVRSAAAAIASCSPHDLRRTFATNLLSAGVSEFTVQRLMGHASPVTTARYDRRPVEHDREAAQLASLAFPDAEA